MKEKRVFKELNGFVSSIKYEALNCSGSKKCGICIPEIREAGRRDHLVFLGLPKTFAKRDAQNEDRKE